MLVGMHITRLPEVREAILDERFQHVSCPNCSFINPVEKPSIYTDFERKHYIGIELPGMHNWRQKVKIHRQAFEQAFFWGPPIAQQMARSMMTRVVFGLRALREKILIWDAGFDDRIVEIGKKEILDCSGVDRQRFVLRVQSIESSQKSIRCELFEKPKSAINGDTSQSYWSLSKPIDSLTIFDKTLHKWHRNAQALIDQNPWARHAWLVDASITEH